MLSASANCTLSSAPDFPLSLSGSGRRLRNPSGTTRLINVAAASWDMIQAISLADFQSFVDTQVSRGFNALHISAVSKDTARFPSDSGNHFGAPNWKTTGGTSVPPFTTPGNFSTFNPTYAAHLRDCLAYCASKVCSDGQRGVLVFLLAPYIGYDLGDPEGWGDDMVADTDAHLQAFGGALATAIASYSNVIMVAGGDYRPPASSTIESRMLAFVAGFLAVDSTRLWGGHFDGDTFGNGSTGTLGGDLSTDQAAFASAIGSTKLLRTHYAYNQSGKRARRRIRDAYQASPTQAAFELDPSYENDNFTSSAKELRSRTHETMCEGSASMAYARGGNSPDGWVFLVSLGAIQGTNEHGYAWNFWSAIPSATWETMAPDAAVFVTAGRGTDSDTSDAYVSVLAATGCLVAYFPSGSSRTITLDMSKFTGAGAFSSSGVRRARWYDPTSGNYTPISTSLSTSGTRTFGAAGTHTFPSSGTNSAGDSDWLLIVD